MSKIWAWMCGSMGLHLVSLMMGPCVGLLYGFLAGKSDFLREFFAFGILGMYSSKGLESRVGVE